MSVREGIGGAAEAIDLAALFAAWQARHGAKPAKAAKLHADVLALLNPDDRPRQYVAARLRELHGARSGGLVLIGTAPAGKWGSTSYALHPEADTPDGGAVPAELMLAPPDPAGGSDPEPDTAGAPPPPMLAEVGSSAPAGILQNADRTPPPPLPAAPATPIPPVPAAAPVALILPPEPEPPPTFAGPPVLPTLPPPAPTPRRGPPARQGDVPPSPGDVCMVCHYGRWWAEATPPVLAWRCQVCVPCGSWAGITTKVTWEGRL